MRRIYYVPGILSAVMIPIMFWFYGNRELQKPIPNVIDLVLPHKVHSTSSKEEKNRIYQNSFEPYRSWNYKKIIVKPNTARQNSNYYVSELKNYNKEIKKKQELSLSSMMKILMMILFLF